MIARCIILFTALLVVAAPAWAQGNLEAERESLSGISAFAVDVTVEGPQRLTEALEVGSLGNRVTQRLRESGLPIAARGDQIPFLHVHLNMMALDNGLVPFSVEVGFHQNARLARNGTHVTAVTWNESVLGLVSYDLVDAILESVDELAAQFARDFETAN